MNRSNLVFVSILFSIQAFAQAPDIIRGPYLNSVSSTSAIIRWRTEKPTDSKVTFSKNFPEAGQVVEVVDRNVVADHEITIKDLSPATNCMKSNFYLRLHLLDLPIPFEFGH
jgi:hypothetical protein